MPIISSRMNILNILNGRVLLTTSYSFKHIQDWRKVTLEHLPSSISAAHPNCLHGLGSLPDSGCLSTS